MANKHLKSNIDLINDCNQSVSQASRVSSSRGAMICDSEEALREKQVSGLPGTYGHLLQEVARSITWQKGRWKVDHDSREIQLLGDSERERTQWLRETLLQEKEKGTFHLLSLWTGECCPVYGSAGDLVLSIERIAAPLFGVITYGVQLLAYTEKDKGLYVWVAKRAQKKRTFPGMLDSTVGGSLTTGETPFDCLVREASEEASFNTGLTKSKATAVGAISYMCLTDDRSKGEKGLLCPEMQSTYEMRVSADLIPVPGDGEAEGFVLMSIDQIKEASTMATLRRRMQRLFSISSFVMAF